jgi:hypothetical protein
MNKLEKEEQNKCPICFEGFLRHNCSNSNFLVVLFFMFLCY